MRKIAFVTGATSGIGYSTATIFASNGWDVIITGRRSERLEKIAIELNDRYRVNIFTLTFDVRSFEETEKAINSLPAEWKFIDVLVNNAGLASGLNPIQDGDLSDWEAMIDTNIKGLLYMTKLVSPLMIANGRGHIINIGSIAGREIYPNGNVYCGTKAAVDFISKGMRVDMLKYGIRVTLVAPGAVNTEFSAVRFHGDQQRADAVYTGYQPLSGDDVAQVVWFAATLPPHININDVTVVPTAQAGATMVYRGE
jgi:NADP-dependent 3-hydroxy acid dehydrogenase YdfG